MIYFIYLFVFPLFAIIFGILFFAVYKEYDRKKERSMIRRYAPHDIECITFEIKYEKNDEYYKQFLDSYFKLMLKYIYKSEKEIIVLDYLAHHRAFNTINDRRLVNKYNEYFNHIEDFVSKKGIKYTRIIQLPLQIDNDENKKEKVIKAVNYMFIETLEHIIRMFQSKRNFQFHILNAALRPYSLMIIDDKYLICEYDRYNIRGISMPDHIIVNRADSLNIENIAEIEALIKNHREKLNKVIQDKKNITLNEIYDAINNLPSNFKPFKAIFTLDENELNYLFKQGLSIKSKFRLQKYNTEEIKSLKKAVSKKQNLRKVG